MLSEADLDIIIRAGEDDKIERKKLVDLTDKAAKAEFILDFLSLANAHGPRPAYLLIGVTNNGDLFDVTPQRHDDARFQQIIGSYVEPPLSFSYFERSVRSITVGVIEIQPSATRFHVVAKDLGDNQKKFLDKGETRIKRGSSKQRPGAWDYTLLREEAAQSKLPQPNLAVAFPGGDVAIEVTVTRQRKHVEGRDVIGYQQVSEASYLIGTGILTFEVTNTGKTQADNVHVFIYLPKQCRLQDEIEAPMAYLIPGNIAASLRDSTTVYPEDGQIALTFPRIVHGLMRTSEECYIAFPHVGEAFELTWIAHAGNMIAETSGRLLVNVV